MPREHIGLVLQEATTIGGVEVAMGSIIPVGEYEWMTVYLDYVNGDEAGVWVYPKFLNRAGGVEAQWMDFTVAAGDKVPTLNRLDLTVTGGYYATFDVRGQTLARLFNLADGGTPTGTLTAIIILKGNASR